jgi:DNA-binding beta-propeller fold protein YncE
MRTRILPAITALLTLSVSAFAAKIELIAGGGMRESGAKATECVLREPFGTEFLPDGTMAIIEMVSGNRLLRVDKAGIMKVIGGTGVKGYSGDGGHALKAQINGVHNIAVTPEGHIFLSDAWNYRVRKINGQTGVITTFAGTGKKGFSGDGGPADKAEFGTVIQVALDPAAKHLYVADIDNKRIRRIAIDTGIVETVAGNGTRAKPEDGALAKEAPLSDPRAVVAAADGSFYILERGGNALRFVDTAGKIKTVAGNGKGGLSGDGGPALEATMSGPKHLCLDRDGSVIIADAETNTIRRYDPKTGKITRIAGTGKKGDSGVGGDPLACELARPHGVTIAPDGNLIITDSYNNRVLRIVP